MQRTEEERGKIRSSLGEEQCTHQYEHEYSPHRCNRLSPSICTIHNVEDFISSTVLHFNDQGTPSRNRWEQGMPTVAL